MEDKISKNNKFLCLSNKTASEFMNFINKDTWRELNVKEFSRYTQGSYCKRQWKAN